MNPVILVGDIHLLDRPPRSANESYVDDLFDLVSWTIDYAIEREASLVVWSGDVFHHKMPSRTSHALLLRLAPMLRRLQKAQIELRVVVGNHDISNDRIESVHEKQPLGILFATGLAKELDGWHETLPVYGVPWQQRWHQDGVVDEAFERWRSALGLNNDPEPNVMDFEPFEALAVTHAPLYPPEQVESVPFETVKAEDIADAMGRTGFLNYGHIHENHSIYKVNGVTFANVGALSRGSAHEYNFNRPIMILEWTSEGGFVEVEVPAKSADEVFRVAELTKDRAEHATRAAFLADIGSRTLDVASKVGVITDISGREDLPEPVKQRAVAILEEVADD